MKTLKSTLVNLTDTDVEIHFMSINDDNSTEVGTIVKLPLKYIPAQLSLQFAGAVASSPQLLRHEDDK